MTIASLLVVFGFLARLTLHPHNLVPLGGISLFAGARLPWRWALAVPLLAMVASDLVIDLFYYPEFERALLDPVRLTVYGSYLLIVGLGLLVRKAPLPVRIGMAPVASVIFFLTTNFAFWATGLGGYPMTASGLLACYVAGLPFFRWTLLADVAGASMLFGLDAAVRHALGREKARGPAAALDLE